MTTLYLTHADCRRHDMGRWHPECPERLDAIADHLLAIGLRDVLIERDAPNVTPEQLARAHDPRYLAELQRRLPESGYAEMDSDTLMNPHSLEAASRAAGAAVAAVDAVLEGEADAAFCAVRPPGHHAERDRAMGFCLYNNVVVAALHALEHHGLQRIAVVDFDVHHGNGTEQMLADDPRVLMCSFFQHPFYPYSGAGPHAPNMVNLPVEAYADGAVIRPLVEQHWLPRLREHRPELILISAGFDAHRDDDMGQLGLVEDDYAWITRQLRLAAQEAGHDRIVSCLEGGYDLPSLARSVAAHVRELL
ncbi:MAG: histone deacetylase family protein [Pigmentiphaga sp.]